MNTGTIKFKKWFCELVQGRYSNGRIALKLVDTEDGGPIATATVNLPDEPLAEDECFLKDYSENEGMVEALTAAGIVQPTGRVVKTGFAEAIHCKLVGEQGRDR